MVREVGTDTCGRIVRMLSPSSRICTRSCRRLSRPSKPHERRHQHRPSQRIPRPLGRPKMRRRKPTTTSSLRALRTGTVCPPACLGNTEQGLVQLENYGRSAAWSHRPGHQGRDLFTTIERRAGGSDCPSRRGHRCHHVRLANV
jgi:hypothetical protein